MPAEITQENVRLLIPGKAARMATLIAAHRHITPKAALLAFYHSKTYRELERAHRITPGTMGLPGKCPWQ